MLDVFKSLGRQPSIASIILEISSTVEQLLLGEALILPLALNVPMGFQGAHSGEGPAGSTTALVLDGSHHSIIIPFESARNFNLSSCQSE